MVTQTSTRQLAPDITVFEITGRLSLGNTLASVEDSQAARCALPEPPATSPNHLRWFASTP
jgi:hypothetical protein